MATTEHFFDLNAQVIFARMIYFIDDMNMPEVDTYGTVQPHTLIR